MIIKGKQSEEIEPLKQEELVDKYMKDLFKNCKHGLTFERPNPDGNLPKVICQICGDEVIGHIDFRKSGGK